MNTDKRTVGVVVPTYNGGQLWGKVVEALESQRSDFDKVLIIDSGSVDDTVSIAMKAGFLVEKISVSDFDYGATRNLGFSKVDCDIVVFLTQDAIPAQNSISSIVQVFDDENVAVAYARQLPHDNANPIASHARLFNYKDKSYTYVLSDKEKHGIKTAFSSNTFAAYRKKCFLEIGGFYNNANASEDMYFAAKALLAGYKVSYVAEATCKHSHNYTPVQEFKRYFDVGVFHQNEPWIRDSFGKLQREGIKFVFSEFYFLLKRKKLLWAPYAFVNNAFRIVGYKMGWNYKKLPKKLCVRFSICKYYWSRIR